MEESIQYAKKYLEDVLSFFGLNIDIHATTTDGEVIELSVPSTHLNGFLIGQHGDTMRALQSLVGTALKNQGHEHARVNVDIADYKKQRAEQTIEKAKKWIAQVKESGEDLHLRPMSAADRRVVHQYAAEQGILSVSEGEDRDRHIVLKLAD